MISLILKYHFLLVSKQDGSITKEIKVPFKEKKLFIYSYKKT